MKIAILTSGILPVPSVQGGAVETLIDYLLEYNDKHKLHDITIYSVYHPTVDKHPALRSEVNRYEYIDTISTTAKIRKRMHGILHRHTYYHYSIDYFLKETLSRIKGEKFDCIIIANRPGFALEMKHVPDTRIVHLLGNDFLNNEVPHSEELYRAASLIIANSNYIKSRVQTCNPDDTKCVTVYNGIDLSPFSVTPVITRETLGYDKDDFILAFSGRLIPEKGILELIEAMNMIKEEPRIKLLVMGSSFYGNDSSENPFVTELKTRAEGVRERILFTGYVRHDEIPDYLRLADVAVIPSTWEEPFGLTVVEGMAAGLPVITTNRGGIPEIVSKDNAIVIPFPGDFSGNLARAIMYLYHHKDEHKSMGKMSKFLSGKFSKETYAKNTFDAISRII